MKQKQQGHHRNESQHTDQKKMLLRLHLRKDGVRNEKGPAEDAAARSVQWARKTHSRPARDWKDHKGSQLLMETFTDSIYILSNKEISNKFQTVIITQTI